MSKQASVFTRIGGRPALERVLHAFYDKAFAHPTPVQGEWTIDGINLPTGVLAKIYSSNAATVVPALRGLRGLRSDPTP